MPRQYVHKLDRKTYGSYYIDVCTQYIDRSWQHSPRVNGILRLHSLPYSKWKSAHESWNFVSNKMSDFVLMPHGIWRADAHPASQPDYKTGMPALEAESYARLRGKLYKGSASLGVTAGSYKESRQMIVNNYDLWMAKNQNAITRARLNRRNVLFTASDDYLEYIFGVKPLYEDIRKTVYELCQHATPPEFVSAKAHAHFPIYRKYYDSGTEQKWFSGNMTMRCNRSTQVEISNPNLWLAERAGLLNIGSVAWDLVPWSFLLNMFVNLNQLVQSVTDYVGLSFPNGSMTKRSTLAGRELIIGGFVPFGKDRPYMIGSALLRTDNQNRTTSAVARPPLTMKLPGVNWETAAMAASLCTQQLNRIPVVRAFRKFKI